MEIMFLGTSCMQPTKERNHPGMLVIYKGVGMLFDCGEGIQRQLRIAGIKPTVIRKIFISHWHGDHVLGLPGLLQTLGASEYAGVLEIYGPRGTKRYVELMMRAFASKGVLELKVKEVKKGKFCEEEEFFIEADELVHSAACVGYAFKENDRRKIDTKKIKRFGIPSGPLIGELQNGRGVVFKGKKIKPDDVSEVVKGRKVVYATDTRPCNGLLRLAKNADLLIVEATYKSDLEEKAKEYYHMTAKEAAQIASESNAKQLVLTHFSNRYKDVGEIEGEAKDIFRNTKAAYDFMKIKL